MALNLNGNSPKKILFNGLNVAKVLFNGVVVWIAKILQFLSGYPLTLENSTGENLVDYKIYGNQDPEAIILPDEYVRLDYIESTGTQYINTGFKPNPKTTRVETTFQVTDNTKINQRLFGARKNYSDVKTMCNIFWNSQQMRNAFRVDWVGNVSTVSSKFSLNTDITMICENNIVTINSLKYKSSTDKSTTYLDYEFYINVFFDAGNTTSVQSPAYVKWKTFKIYDDGTLVRDFIPCKNAEGIAGLYDLVENKFYSNSGIGDFVAGREITTKVGKVGDEYYKAGEQLYKIPIKVSNDTETEYEIYLNKPLGKIEENADYIDFENQEVAYYDYLTDTYTKENIELPEIPTQEGTNIITVETSLKPSKMDIKYYKKGV